MAAKAKTKTVYVSAKPVVDEFGEVAKVLVIVAGSIVGGIVALIMIWQFIHWAARPDLGSIEDSLSLISQRVDSLYFTQQTSTGNAGTISIPNGYVCDFGHAIATCRQP
jgi:putative transposon-encoded protein